MTQEDKELLLRDLCARLPYDVKIRLGDYDYQVCSYNSEKEMPVKIWYYYNSNLTLKSYIDVYLEDYHPYLRSMSSMTKEEIKELLQISNFDPVADDICFNSICCIERTSIDITDIANVISWLNEHHFDYCGLIEKGLAIEVTEENNPYKE